MAAQMLRHRLKPSTGTAVATSQNGYMSKVHSKPFGFTTRLPFSTMRTRTEQGKRLFRDPPDVWHPSHTPYLYMSIPHSLW
eukprot:6474529-Amphidinium_carterae.1